MTARLLRRHKTLTWRIKQKVGINYGTGAAGLHPFIMNHGKCNIDLLTLNSTLVGILQESALKFNAIKLYCHAMQLYDEIAVKNL